MKLFKQFLFLGLATMFFSTSCTMEKRVYSFGYHIEWNRSKHNTDKKEFAKNEIKKQAEQNKIETFQQPKNKTNPIVLIEKKQITKSQNEKNIFSTHPLKSPINIAKIDTSIAKENIKKESTSNNEDKKSIYSHFAVKGFIFSMIEFLILISILISLTLAVTAYDYIPALIAIIILCFPFILFITLAIVYSVKGLQQIKKENVKGKRLAIVGLVVGLLPIGIFIIGLLIYLFSRI